MAVVVVDAGKARARRRDDGRVLIRILRRRARAVVVERIDVEPDFEALRRVGDALRVLA